MSKEGGYVGLRYRASRKGGQMGDASDGLEMQEPSSCGEQKKRLMNSMCLAQRLRAGTCVSVRAVLRLCVCGIKGVRALDAHPGSGPNQGLHQSCRAKPPLLGPRFLGLPAPWRGMAQRLMQVNDLNSGTGTEKETVLMSD